MSKPANISTYDELEQRKRELELEVEVSQRELAHSLGTSRVNLNDFLLKKVALPIGGAIAGVWMLSKFTGKKKRHTHTIHETRIVEKAPSDGDAQARNHYPVPPPRPPKEEREHGYVSQRPRSAAAQMAVTNENGEAELRSEPKKDEVLAPKNKRHLINMATVASVVKIALPAVKMIFKHIKDHKDQLAGHQPSIDESAGSGYHLASGAPTAAGKPKVAVGHS